jgi:hypothetical protein
MPVLRNSAGTTGLLPFRFSRYSRLQLWWHLPRSPLTPRILAKIRRLPVDKLRVDGPQKLPVRLDGSTRKGPSAVGRRV